MRSKVFQRILDEIESKPWWYRFRLNLKVEWLTFKSLGFMKYFKLKK
jgi:hypothetical protein